MVTGSRNGSYIGASCFIVWYGVLDLRGVGIRMHISRLLEGPVCMFESSGAIETFDNAVRFLIFKVLVVGWNILVPFGFSLMSESLPRGALMVDI